MMRKILLFALGSMILCILQGCSIHHLFYVKNDTQQTWMVRYNIQDSTGVGVFKKNIKIVDQESKEPTYQIFEDGIVQFELPPGYSAQIGYSRNTTYQSYKNQNKRNEKMPLAPFVNIDELILESGEQTFRRKGTDLASWMDQQDDPLAVIVISKLLEDQ